VVADLVALSVLDYLSPTEPDSLPRELLEAGAHRAEVHQASGMVAVQLGIGVAEAGLRLRAYAYATNRSIAAVASEVVGRHLRLGSDPT
jgi:AmiR/NasT family two-component response regulator